MTNITNLNSQRFTLNGIPYYKNFLSQIIGDPVSGNLVRIVNAYDSKMELLRPTRIDEISVNGLTYPTAQALQNVLLPILYSRGTLGDGNANENGIIQMGPIELIPDPIIANLLTVKIPILPVVPIWRIGGVDYSKDTETLIPIPAAAEDKYRIDTIVANTANGFERIAGEERSDVGVPPQLPYNVIVITQVNVFGEDIDDPSDPLPPGNQFVTKSSKRYRSNSAPNPQLLFLSQEYTTHLLKPSSVGQILKGFFMVTDLPGGVAYDGMDIFLKNSEVESVSLKHNDGTATVPFWFAEETDLEIKQNDILHFKYNAVQNRVELLKLSNVAPSLEATVTADTGTTVNLSNPVGNSCNMLSANGNSAFTTTGAIAGGEATILINRATEPTVTGATKIPGHTFQANTDMHLKVKCRQTGIVQYYFLKLT